jgi:hypothetical protein
MAAYLEDHPRPRHAEIEYHRAPSVSLGWFWLVRDPRRQTIRRAVRKELGQTQPFSPEGSPIPDAPKRSER